MFLVQSAMCGVVFMFFYFILNLIAGIVLVSEDIIKPVYKKAFHLLGSWRGRGKERNLYFKPELEGLRENLISMALVRLYCISIRR